MPRASNRRRWVVMAMLGALGIIGIGLWRAWPRLFPNPLAQATAAYDRGDWNAASALAASRLKEAPGDREALRLMARTAARQFRGNVARGLYARLGGAKAMEADDYYLVGLVSDRAGDHETARMCWVFGLEAEPKHAGILERFGRIYRLAGQVELARRVAAELAKRPGWEARGDLMLGRLALEDDDPATAVAALRRALDRDPAVRDDDELFDTSTRPRARILLARALLETSQPVPASDVLTAFLTEGPDAEGSWLLSRAQLQAGKLAGAAAALEQSRSYRDEHPMMPEAAPYVGAASCAECHREKYRTQQSSLHAHTFVRTPPPTPADFPATGQPITDPGATDVHHTVTAESNPSRLRVTTTAPGGTSQAILDYLFGSGHHARTAVGHEEDGRNRELRLSHYTEAPHWDLTTGQVAQPPAGEGYLGRILTTDDVYTCLSCHTTVPRAAREQSGPVAADHSIGCERCHGPGGNHLTAIAAKFSDPAIAQPRHATAAQIITLCGECHGPFKVEAARNNPLAPRFPAPSLTWSRCYTESNGALDCRNCHDPHRDSETDPAYYDAKCLECHGAAKPKTSGPHKTLPTAHGCPVNPSQNCVSCHMPKVDIKVSHILFTDHYIRIFPKKTTSPP